ncbi:flagellar motor switch protein FliN [Spirochaetia bacterium 38H-sp]|uniref:Flagellar motor switch protein FliN n=1 Tax=Rarispira pelagica TaxID=3141764 RepID=A0ABU9UDB1_9SPIR
MSDGALTQEEIDALLQGTVSFDTPAGGPPPSLSDSDVQKFKGIVANTVASQSANLSMLTGKQVNILAPVAKITALDDLLRDFPDNFLHVDMSYTDGKIGAHGYFLDEAAATKIAGFLVGQENVELTEASISALQEGLSQINGPVVTSLGDFASVTILTAPPQGALVSKNDFSLSDKEFVILDYPVDIEGESVSIKEYFSSSLVMSLINLPASQSSMQQPSMGQNSMQGINMADNTNAGANLWGAGAPQVQQVQFPQFGDSGLSAEQQTNISLLMDVYMELTVELGRTRKMVKEILGMGEGTIIELDKLAGEPVDILVNHKLIARGEVVVIDENFGVRVTEIISPLARVNQLS